MLILTDASIVAVSTLASKMIDLIMLVIQDQPKEERVKAWQRWFQFWEPLWKALGLEVKGPLI